MDPNTVPLLDELASALNAARQEIRRLHNVLTPKYEGKIGEPDLEIASQADQAISRFEIERDRADLDAATLPTVLVIALQDGAISNILTDSRLPVEVAIINYDIDADWKGEDMVSVPQTDGHPDVMAVGYLLRPGVMPERVRQLHRAVYRAGCAPYSNREH